MKGRVLRRHCLTQNVGSVPVCVDKNKSYQRAFPTSAFRKSLSENDSHYYTRSPRLPTPPPLPSMNRHLWEGNLAG